MVVSLPQSVVRVSEGTAVEWRHLATPAAAFSLAPHAQFRRVLGTEGKSATRKTWQLVLSVKFWIHSSLTLQHSTIYKISSYS